MSSDATDNTMRAGFEAWIVTEWGDYSLSTAGDGMGGYAAAAIDDAWRAWQAARADTARQIEQAVAAERKAMDRLLQVAGLGLPIRGTVYITLAHVRACLATRSNPTPPTA